MLGRFEYLLTTHRPPQRGGKDLSAVRKNTQCRALFTLLRAVGKNTQCRALFTLLRAVGKNPQCRALFTLIRAVENPGAAHSSLAAASFLRAVFCAGQKTECFALFSHSFFMVQLSIVCGARGQHTTNNNQHTTRKTQDSKHQTPNTRHKTQVKRRGTQHTPHNAHHTTRGPPS